MGRITARAPVTRIVFDEDGAATRRLPDTLVVEEPLEIRLAGDPFTVTMRTPGSDLELAAGFLTGEGIIGASDDLRSAIHCGGPGSAAGDDSGQNTYNVLDVALAPAAAARADGLARTSYTTSSCGVCGSASIDKIAKTSRFDVAGEGTAVSAAWLVTLPDVLRAGQSVFAK
ncbi:MAG TPA: formate dehydrogenase accessory sulfurtransferase FdhD, partial [Microbacterium sp.]|nr:formate dehydrogenase accessory sulfurtransferase FdhD [Microbacterium sp.]